MTRQARPAARQVQSPLLESAARLERVANGQAFGQNAPSRPAALAALQMSMARFEMNRELDTQDPAWNSTQSVARSDLRSLQDGRAGEAETYARPWSVRNGDVPPLAPSFRQTPAPLPDLVTSTQPRAVRPTSHLPASTATSALPEGIHGKVAECLGDRYRSSDGNARLVNAAEQVKQGVDYRTLGYLKVSSEFNALQAQAIMCVEQAIPGGMSVPVASERFHIADCDHRHDVYSLMSFAAEKVGVPLIRSGQSYEDAVAALGILGNDAALLLLMDTEFPDQEVW